jgi:ribosome-associated protein
MKTSDLRSLVATAIRAAEDKKAENISILQLEKGAFTDYLVLASGTNSRQVQAIVDEVELKLKYDGVYPNSVEGYKLAEWVLLDYVDFVIQVFSEDRRAHYDLDRLWRHAKKLALDDLIGKVSRARTTPAPAPARTSGGVKRKIAKPKRSRAIAGSIRAAASGGKRTASRKSAKPAPKKASRPKKKK